MRGAPLRALKRAAEVSPRAVGMRHCTQGVANVSARFYPQCLELDQNLKSNDVQGDGDEFAATSIRARPARFARYSASSARARMLSEVSPSSVTATPILNATGIDVPPTRIGSRNVGGIRSQIATASSASRTGALTT